MKWTVIGAGGIADRRAIPAIIKDEGSELVAIMERVPELAKTLGEKYGVDLPLTNAVYELCYADSEEECRTRCDKMLAKMFTRETKSEFYF